ncbi:NAD(P)-binding protein [Imleria badia]|nr:NAD(P)-binding protein [Imleria badia]
MIENLRARNNQEVRMNWTHLYYYDPDADLDALANKKIVFLGFGNQGSVLFILIPDEVQPRVFNAQFSPKMKPNATIVVASGLNVFFARTFVVMAAPRMIGSSVRSLYEKGRGFPCFVSVEQDGTGNGWANALAISRTIGATKQSAIASSAFNVLKDAGCSDEALCYEMWMSKEPAEIFERAADDGFVMQLKHHSTVSQYGQLSGALALDGKAMREHFVEILHQQILNGKFYEAFSLIEEDLEKDGNANPLNELYRRSEEMELVRSEKRVRAWLAGGLL